MSKGEMKKKGLKLQEMLSCGYIYFSKLSLGSTIKKPSKGASPPVLMPLPIRGSNMSNNKISDNDDHVVLDLNTTAFDESYYSCFTGTDDSRLEDISFDVTGRNVTEVVPLTEASHCGALTETILEDRGLTWTVIDD